MAEPTRRAALGKLGLAVAAAAVPAVASAAPVATDPHPAWCVRWRALLDWLNTPGRTAHDDLADFPEWDQMEELEELILTTPSNTAAGAAAQLRVTLYWSDEAGALDDEYLLALNSAIATLDRLAGESAHA